MIKKWYRKGTIIPHWRLSHISDDIYFKKSNNIGLCLFLTFIIDNFYLCFVVKCKYRISWNAFYLFWKIPKSLIVLAQHPSNAFDDNNASILLNIWNNIESLVKFAKRNFSKLLAKLTNFKINFFPENLI